MLLQNPPECMKIAMLFAWADDIRTQEEIKALRTEDDITAFFQSQANVIIIVDQRNGLNGGGDRGSTVSRWLDALAFGKKRVYSSSANDMNYHDQTGHQHNEVVLGVFGGLDEVSHRKIML